MVTLRAHGGTARGVDRGRRARFGRWYERCCGIGRGGAATARARADGLVRGRAGGLLRAPRASEPALASGGRRRPRRRPRRVGGVHERRPAPLRLGGPRRHGRRRRSAASPRGRLRGASGRGLAARDGRLRLDTAHGRGHPRQPPAHAVRAGAAPRRRRRRLGGLGPRDGSAGRRGDDERDRPPLLRPRGRRRVDARHPRDAALLP